MERTERQERHDERETRQRYEERFPGWRRSTSPRACPRRVAGLLCQAGAGHGCICQRYPLLLDHVKLWLPPEGGYAYTAEPYHVDVDALVKFTAECEGLGLEVAIEDYSPYYPGSTKLILVRRKATQHESVEEVARHVPAKGEPGADASQRAAIIMALVRLQGFELRAEPSGRIIFTRDGKDVPGEDTSLDYMTLTTMAELKRQLLHVIFNQRPGSWTCVRCGSGRFDLPTICSLCLWAERRGRPGHA